MKLTERSARRLHYLLLGASVLICSTPFLAYSLTQGHDTGYLMFRLEGVARGFVAGELPPRMQTSQLHGYGYPAGVTFPDLFLYPFALLRAAGLGLNNTYRVLFVCLNAFTAIISYESLRRIAGRNVALAATLLWMFAPYRNEDVLLRSDFGEAMALSFLPVFALGVYRIVWESAGAYRSKGRVLDGWLLCGIAMSGVIYSNLCVTIIMLVFAVPITVALAVANGRLVALAKGALKAVALTLLLTAAFAVPLVDYHLNAQLAYTSGFSSMTRDWMELHAPHPAHLMLLFAPLTGTSVCGRTDPIGFGCMPLAPGWTLLGIGVCALLVIVTPEVWEKSTRRLRPSVAILLAAVALLLLVCTKLFPWDGGASLLDSLVSALASLQYPWRLLGLVSFLLVVCFIFVVCVTRGAVPSSLRRGTAVALVALAMLECGVGVTTFLYYGQRVDAREVLATDSGVYDAQFVPAGTNLAELQVSLADEPVPTAGVDVEDFSRRGSRVTLTVRSRSAGETHVDLPLLLYRYVSILSTSPREPACALSAGHNGVARLTVPSGYEGTLEVGFEEPALWRVAEVVSLLTFVAIVVYRSKKECEFGRHGQ